MTVQGIASPTVHPGIVEILYQMGFLVAAQYKVYTIDGTHLFRLQLRVTTCHDDKGSGVFAHHSVDDLSAFMVGHLRHRASVDEADIGRFALVGCAHAHVLKHLPKGRGFREIEFAP